MHTRRLMFLTNVAATVGLLGQLAWTSTRTRSRSAAFALFAMLAMSGTALAADDAELGFKKPRAEIVASVKTIGVLPLSVAEIVPDPEGVSRRYETEIVARLEHSGFAVVKPEVMREIRRRLEDIFGALYDPVTGAPNLEKIEAFNERARAEYLATQNLDAVLEIGIELRHAQITQYSVAWDGVTDTATGRVGAGSFFRDAMMALGFEGPLRVLSLVVAMRDTHGDLLYERAGGLQVLEYLRVEGMFAQHRRVDSNFIVTQPVRDARALGLALDPLANGTLTASTTKVEPAPAETSEGKPTLHVPLPDFMRRYHRLVIAPLELAAIDQRSDVQARYQSLLANKLTSLGVEVVDGTDYLALWTAEEAASGGYFNPHTGKLDRAKLAASRKRVFAAVREKYPIDAVLIPTIVNRDVSYSNGMARWDGVEETLDVSRKNQVGAIFKADSALMGELPAFSLVVRIADGEDATVFESNAGIGLAQRIDQRELASIPEAALLADEARDVRAIDIALQPFVPPAKRK